jgi:hypothetical protein
MSEKARFLVQARWALNSLIGGADVEKVRRHLPQFEIDATDTGFSVKLREETKTPPPPPAPAAPAGLSELEIAKAAALAAGQGTTAPLSKVE